MGLRRPAPMGFPMAKKVFQLPPPAFPLFISLFLLRVEERRRGEKDRNRIGEIFILVINTY